MEKSQRGSLKFFLSLLLACLCVLPVTAEDAKPPRQQWITRFTLDGDQRMYFRGELVGSDKRTAVTFLIDTGTDVNYISDTTASKAGLPIKTMPESVKNRAPDGKPWQYVVVPSIVSDQLNVGRQVFFLLPANQLPKFAVSTREEKSVDGILGAHTLSVGAMMLDYDQNRMTLWYPGDLSQADRDAQGFQTIYTVPISPMDDQSGRWVAKATLTNGNASTTTALMIDTGINATTIPATAATQIKLRSFSGASATLFLNKVSPTDYGTVDRLQIGDFVTLNHRVCYADRKEDDFPISLGMDIFKGYTVLLDFAQKKMYLGYLKAVAPVPSLNSSPSKEKLSQ